MLPIPGISVSSSELAIIEVAGTDYIQNSSFRGIYLLVHVIRKKVQIFFIFLSIIMEKFGIENLAEIIKPKS